MKKKRLKKEDILGNFTAHVTSSEGISSLTEENLNKMVTQIQLANAVKPYQTPLQRLDFEKLIMGMFEQEYLKEKPKKKPTLQDYLDSLK